MSIEYYTVSLKNYRRIFLYILLCELFILAAGYLWVNGGYFSLPVPVSLRKTTLYLLLLLAVLAFFFMQFHRSQLRKINQLTDPDEKLSLYERAYRFRGLWYIFSCIISCLLYVLIVRRNFVYFGLLNLTLISVYYPKKSLFNRELQSEEIVFI
jgi:hypothetical protein